MQAKKQISLDDLAAKGRDLLRTDDPNDAHDEFGYWVDEVSDYLKDRLPNTGALAQWCSLGHSPLVMGDGYYDDPAAWMVFRKAVSDRLQWLGALPKRIKPKSSPPMNKTTEVRSYVDPVRITQLRNIRCAQFDLSKLIRLCEELNTSLNSDSFLSMIMLTRSIIDHVSPIFGCTKFSEVANNYAGSKSFRESMQHLENSSRKIADQHLHCQIRKSETLPTATQVNFSNDLDVLLAEVVRILK